MWTQRAARAAVFALFVLAVGTAAPSAEAAAPNLLNFYFDVHFSCPGCGAAPDATIFVTGSTAPGAYTGTWQAGSATTPVVIQVAPAASDPTSFTFTLTPAPGPIVTLGGWRLDGSIRENPATHCLLVAGSYSSRTVRFTGGTVEIRNLGPRPFFATGYEAPF